MNGAFFCMKGTFGMCFWKMTALNKKVGSALKQIPKPFPFNLAIFMLPN